MDIGGVRRTYSSLWIPDDVRVSARARYGVYNHAPDHDIIIILRLLLCVRACVRASVCTSGR